MEISPYSFSVLAFVQFFKIINIKCQNFCILKFMMVILCAQVYSCSFRKDPAAHAKTVVKTFAYEIRSITVPFDLISCNRFRINFLSMPVSYKY